jgi:SAM-dependent MidA family methyltransferase
MRWREAMHQALYGPGGFFVQQRPADHFRTSAHVSALFAQALAELVCQVDAALDAPATLDLVDVGAGRGELLAALLRALPDEVRARTRPIAVELGDLRLDAGDIQWRADIPGQLTGVLLATEWLDNVPLELARDGQYLSAELSPGGPLDPADADWIARWWPDPADIVEVGRARDEAWAGAVGALSAGLALTVDYGHQRYDRPPVSTITGFRAGREVAPALDGSTDITCHVAIDSVARAGSEIAGGAPYRLLRQREALRRLGVDGRRPPLTLASTDPTGYVRALVTASEAAELTAQGGLGGHWWLLQPVALDLKNLPFLYDDAHD